MTGRLVALVTLAAAGCGTDVALPPNARVTCGGGDACPEGFVCNAAGRCERTDALDRTPPSLLAPPVVEPRIGRQGTRFEVRFEVDEPLSKAPEVSLDVGPRQAPLEPVGPAASASPWRFVYTATGSEAEGARELTIRLADAAGNEVTDASAVLRLDFTPPRATLASLDRSVAGPGAVARLSVETSEALAEAPPARVWCAGGRDWAAEGRKEDGSYAFSYAALPGEDPEAETVVLAILTDVAGNRADRVELGRLAFDFTQPTVEEQLVEPRAVRDTAALRVQLRVGEPLAEAPVLGVESGPGPLALGQPEQRGRTWERVREVGPADAEGEYSLQVELTDLGANRAAVVLDATVSVDRTPPEILADSVGPAERPPYRNGSEVELALRVSEPLAEPPTILLGSRELGEPRVEADGSYRWLHRLAGQPGDDAELGLVAELTDRAGNRTTDSHTLGRGVLDFPPPVPSATVTPLRAGAGDGGEVSVDVGEPLAEGFEPVLRFRELGAAVDGWQAFAPPVARGLGWAYRRAVADGLAAGRYTFAIDLRDRAGNERLGHRLEPVLEVDVAPPHVLLAGRRVVATCDDPSKPGTPRVTGLFARDGCRVEIGFSLAEALPPDAVRIRVGEVEVAPVLADGSALSAVHRVDAADPRQQAEGPVPVVVQVDDAAGNRTLVTLASLVRDDTPAHVVGTPFFQRDDLYGPARPDGRGNALMAKRGTDVRVSFAVSEPTLVRPRVEVAGASFLAEAWDPQRTAFDVVVTDPGEEGEAVVLAWVADRAGNTPEGLLELGRIDYDYTEPPAPVTDADEPPLFRRAPWGKGERGAVPAFSVEGPPGSVEPEGTVVVYDSPGAGRSELGRGPADAAGGFAAVELVQFDQAAVWLGVVDRAGNPSPLSPVREVEWIATLAHKAAGSDIENPSTVWSNRWTAEIRTHPEPSEVDGEALGQRDGELLETLGGGAWRVVRQGVAVSHLGPRHAAHTYDSARGRLLVFSGTDGADHLWEWDGESRRWDLECGVRTACSGPPASVMAAMAYDASRGCAVLLDGEDGAVWEWHGAVREWRRVCGAGTPCGGGPESWSASPVMVYDSARRRTLVHDEFSQTWSWDGERRVWTLLSEDGPPSRSESALVWDSLRGRALLFSGTLDDELPGDDLWELDPETMRWEQVCGFGTGCSGPAQRSWHALAFDRRTGRTVLYGGIAIDTPIGTWEWDPGDRAWTRTCGLGLACEGPGLRFGHVLSYDERRGRVVLTAGSGEADQTDAWEYGGAERTWARVHGLGMQSPGMTWLTNSKSMAFDEARGRAVLHGNGAVRRPETWEWHPEEQVWYRACGSATACVVPQMDAESPALVWDSSIGRILQVGPTTTWSWNGVAWQVLCSPETGCEHPQLDASRKAVFTPLGAVWEFDATARLWSGVCARAEPCALPGAREEPGLAVDEKGGLLLFGGRDRVWDRHGGFFAWRWERGRWAGLAEDDAGPAPSYGPAMLADRARLTAVLFGGAGARGLGNLSETWEWRPQEGSWHQVCDPAICRNPGERYRSAVTWDPVSAAVLLYSGAEDRDTWSWSQARRRPAQQLSFARFRSIGDVTLRSLRLEAVTGATSEADGAAAPGVRARLWDEGRYRELVRHAAPADAPAALVWQSADPYLLDRAFRFGADRTLTVVLEPLGENGRGTARLTTDYVELKVRYSWAPE